MLGDHPKRAWLRQYDTPHQLGAVPYEICGNGASKGMADDVGRRDLQSFDEVRKVGRVALRVGGSGRIARRVRVVVTPTVSDGAIVRGEWCHLSCPDPIVSN